MNTTPRTIPIIAVFGGSEPHTLQLAQWIGCEVARQKCILLAGGEGKHEEAVKDKAIDGAEEANGEGLFAPWIGVARDNDPQDSEPSEDSRYFVIHPGFDHKRNYIEACLCDAAIALEGGKGTASEVTFCLSLQKPVVLVGNTWEQDYPLAGSEKDKTLDKLVETAFRRVGTDSSRNSTLDQLLTKETIRQHLAQSLPAYKYYSIPPNADEPVEAKQIVEHIRSLLSQIKLMGEFPPLQDYEAMKDKYNRFIAEIERRYSE
jgi:uncharacterized protein (TIGR00725 family)